ncbi:uncharacterized protein LOC105217080 [Zeugodacus cucurbitae]|uniref:Probable kinetochore protein ndc-80 n=1 Tax=Zeugodacus cucurbitae TaxID=28588 RepID=A0A0A1XGZ0_ZEUCU|nr:uncharacterized protein LOC105217080 [Zeugodacus cucurbitae]
MKRKLQQKRIKRWTQDEICKIIDYIAEYGNLEKPTARIYYETFLQVSPIDATWDLIKWKVRHLKAIFAKAEQWTSSAEAKSLSTDRFVERLQKMCPYYHRLRKIFGEKQAQIVEILESNDSFSDCYNDEFEDNNDMAVDVKVFADFNALENFYPVETVESINLANKSCPEVEVTQMSTNSTPALADVLNEQLIAETECGVTVRDGARDRINEQMGAKKQKKESLRHSLSALSQSQESRNEMHRLRLKFEEYKFVQEFQFVKQKFEAEMELKKQELELKKMEIESNEKLRLMEIEKSERLAKYELNLKYNCHNDSLHTD